MKNQYYLEVNVLEAVSDCESSIALVTEDPENPLDEKRYWIENRPAYTEAEIEEKMRTGYLTRETKTVHVPECVVRQIRSDALCDASDNDLLAELELRGFPVWPSDMKEDD